MQDIMNLKRFYYLGRFNSLTGAWLLILPSFWSIACNVNSLAWNQQVYYYGIFVLGALFMRSFGCVINDLVDINIDKQVARIRKYEMSKSKEGRFTLAKEKFEKKKEEMSAEDKMEKNELFV